MLHDLNILHLNFSFSIVILNILIYLFSTLCLFMVFFFFNLDSFLNLNNWKIFTSSYFYYFFVLILLLSMLGMPPMAGFCGKFLMSIFLSLNSSFFYFIVFIFLNLFMIYFYLQNFRFLIKKKNSLDINNNSMITNYTNLYYLVIFLFFLTFFIFFSFDFSLILNSLLFF